MRRVDPRVYTKKYYLTDCTGYNEYKQTFGKKLEPRLKRIVKDIPIKKNQKILDIGCGRGELTFWAAEKDCQATGIDYSINAVKLAKLAQAKRSSTIKARTKFKLMDAKDLKFPPHSFDAVFLVEILEHIYPEEQDQVFRQIKKILKPDGFIFIHTAPSSWFNDFTYKYWCYPISSLLVFIWKLITGNSYPNLAPPKQIRTASHLIMHINEPDYFSLKKLFNRHKFYGQIRSTNITIRKPHISWKDKLFNFIVYLYPLSNYFPLNIFWANDFLVVLRNK